MITVPVRQITNATPRIRLLNLDLRAADFSFTAGQAVMVGLSGSPLRKPYSIASAPWEVTKSGIMQVLVQVEDSGGLDPHLELASPGTMIDLDGPFGSFGLPARVALPLMFVAGGTGIAPLRSMLHEAFESATPPRVSVLYSARTAEEFAFDDELTTLAHDGRIRYVKTATRETSAGWPGGRGRITRAQLEAVVDAAETRCFVCGPAALVHEVPRLLGDIGVTPDRIRVEEWAAPRAATS
jgi:ferredoxin-NADP reductase